MQLMKEGAKWELYIPSELGYGDQGAGGVIPGGAVLVFTLELLKVCANFWFG
jgi:FKBP-type peptidyl-prolyl cis-trans isomerase FklB